MSMVLWRLAGLQDYFYVGGFVRMLGATLAKVPASAIDVVATGITYVNAELTWFKEKAKERNIDLENQSACT